MSVDVLSLWQLDGKINLPVLFLCVHHFNLDVLGPSLLLLLPSFPLCELICKRFYVFILLALGSVPVIYHNHSSLSHILVQVFVFASLVCLLLQFVEVEMSGKLFEVVELFWALVTLVHNVDLHVHIALTLFSGLSLNLAWITYVMASECLKDFVTAIRAMYNLFKSFVSHELSSRSCDLLGILWLLKCNLAALCWFSFFADSWSLACDSVFK